MSLIQDPYVKFECKAEEDVVFECFSEECMHCFEGWNGMCETLENDFLCLPIAECLAGPCDNCTAQSMGLVACFSEKYDNIQCSNICKMEETTLG